MPKNNISSGTIGDLERNNARGVTDYTQDGNCSNCGACCSARLPLMGSEIKRIRRFVRESGYKPHRFALTYLDLTCPFRNNEKRCCDIYKIRPAICRDFLCANPSRGIWANAALYTEPIRMVDMRSEFFHE